MGGLSLGGKPFLLYHRSGHFPLTRLTQASNGGSAQGTSSSSVAPDSALHQDLCQRKASALLGNEKDSRAKGRRETRIVLEPMTSLKGRPTSGPVLFPQLKAKGPPKPEGSRRFRSCSGYHLSCFEHQISLARKKTTFESQSKPGTKMVNPEPSKERICPAACMPPEGPAQKGRQLRQPVLQAPSQTGKECLQTEGAPAMAGAPFGFHVKTFKKKA